MNQQMGTTLIVVDMQPKFAASAEIIEAVVHQVKLAKQRKAGVILVEYESRNGSPHDPTWPAIYDACQWKLGRATVITKKDDNGGSEVARALDATGFNQERLRVVGVNRSACVIDTISGLHKLMPKAQIEMVWGATENQWKNSRYYDMREFRRRLETDRFKII